MFEPYGHTIFCDDIRQELGNKLSYMGRYMVDMVVNSPPPAPGEPVIIPKLCAAVQITAPREYEFRRMRIAMIMDIDGGEQVTLAEFRTEREEATASLPDGQVQFVSGNFFISPLMIPRECFIRARAYLDDHEVKAGSLAVRFDSAGV